MRRTDAWSWMADVLPFVAMLTITCLDMAVLTIVKAAMNDGMGSIVFVIYHNALGTLILLPFFILHIIRNVDRPPLTLRILFRFFILSLLGLCLFQVLVYVGVSYSSPTLASAIWNLGPGITFFIAVIFRMEKLNMRSSSTIAKLLGTIMATSGAMVLTFYQGPSILNTILSSNSSNQVFLSQHSNWIFGGLIIATGGIFSCIWVVLHTATTIEYPDQQTIVFFYCLFGTLQCIALSPFIERKRSAWLLQTGIKVIAVVLGGVYSTALRISILTWCLQKKGPIFVSMFSPLSIVIAIILGVTFLGDSLYLGSAIGATIIAAGFYMVIWGRTKEKITEVMGDELDISDRRGSSDQTACLLPSRNESTAMNTSAC